jgi:hypothetical protein
VIDGRVVALAGALGTALGAREAVGSGDGEVVRMPPRPSNNP